MKQTQIRPITMPSEARDWGDTYLRTLKIKVPRVNKTLFRVNWISTQSDTYIHTERERERTLSLVSLPLQLIKNSHPKVNHSPPDVTIHWPSSSWSPLIPPIPLLAIEAHTQFILLSFLLTHNHPLHCTQTLYHYYYYYHVIVIIL